MDCNVDACANTWLMLKTAVVPIAIPTIDKAVFLRCNLNPMQNGTLVCSMKFVSIYALHPSQQFLSHVVTIS